MASFTTDFIVDGNGVMHDHSASDLGAILDTRYLKLDCSNDPLTGSLEITGKTADTYPVATPANLAYTINYNPTYGDYFNDGVARINYRVYAYKTINGTVYYSLPATFVSDIQDNGGNDSTYNVELSWDAVSGAEGYKITVYIDYAGPVYTWDYEDTITATTIIDAYTDYGAGYLSVTGPTTPVVTPNSVLGKSLTTSYGIDISNDTVLRGNVYLNQDGGSNYITGTSCFSGIVNISGVTNHTEDLNTNKLIYSVREDEGKDFGWGRVGSILTNWINTANDKHCIANAFDCTQTVVMPHALDANIYTVAINHSTGASNAIVGTRFNAYVSTGATASVAAVRALEGKLVVDTQTTVTDARVIQTQPTSIHASATVTSLYGIYVGTVEGGVTSKGLYIQGATASSGTNKYGLHIGSISGAATLNYSIYTENGAVRFGDAVTSTSTITGTRFISNIAVGTSPYSCTSTTLNTNLNADMVDSKHVGTSGNTIPLLDGTNTWSATQLIGTTTQVQFRDSAIGIYSQADSYLNIFSDGGVRIGDSTPTNYTMFDSAGHQTMVGTAQPWEDVRVEPVIRNTGVNNPAFEQWFDDSGIGDTGTTRGVYLYTFHNDVEASEDEVHFTIQMPHSWNSGAVHIHVHWITKTTASNSKVRWGLEYTWAEPGATFGATPAILYASTPESADTGTTAGKHQITEFTALTPTSSQDGLSSILICRLFRNSSHADDTYTGDAGLLYIDAHYQLARLGSNDEYTP